MGVLLKTQFTHFDESCSLWHYKVGTENVWTPQKTRFMHARGQHHNNICKLFLIQHEETLRIFHESYNPHWVNSPLQKNRNSKLPELIQLLSSTFEAGYEAVQILFFIIEVGMRVSYFLITLVTYMELRSFKETTQAVVKSLDGFYIISIGVRFSYFLMHTSFFFI
jgi:hypothetical protein